MNGQFYEEWEHQQTTCPADVNKMPEPPRGVCWQLVSVILTDEPVMDDAGNLYSRRFLRAYWKRPVAASEN
jgi:hypothetical protein